MVELVKMSIKLDWGDAADLKSIIKKVLKEAFEAEKLLEIFSIILLEQLPDELYRVFENYIGELEIT